MSELHKGDWHKLKPLTKYYVMQAQAQAVNTRRILFPLTHVAWLLTRA